MNELVSVSNAYFINIAKQATQLISSNIGDEDEMSQFAGKLYSVKKQHDTWRDKFLNIMIMTILQNRKEEELACLYEVESIEHWMYVDKAIFCRKVF